MQRTFCLRRLSLVLVAIVVLHSALNAQSKKKSVTRRGAAPKAAVEVALTQRERALQMLNRFTFGGRPGEAEAMMAEGDDGPQRWFERQLDPVSIDDSALEKRLAAYPTLAMSPEQILTVFPDRRTVQSVAEKKQPYPTDPQLAAMYEVQVYKYNQQVDARKANLPLPTEKTEDDKSPNTIQDKATAARIAGDLFAIPPNKRMATLMAMPVPDRIAFTKYVGGEQRNLLLNDFTPKERELFNAMAYGVGSSGQAVSELQQARILRDILSERQLQAVMADFWFNHFNVYAPKDSDQWYTTSYERDVIRRNALGKFRDLLIATAQSPAMMVYLDNFTSIGPNSVANGGNNANGKRGNRGLNENYAREVMELHTLSVNGGYTQADVTQLAAMLTGWSVDRPQQGGPFLYEQKKHEPGTKQWMGETINEAGQSEGLNALKVLAASPKTAHFISWKLAQRFVADDPPSALVDRMTQTYLTSDGDIKTILRTMVQSKEFNERRYFRNKMKTPVEFVASTFRSTATDPTNAGVLVQTIERMGMGLYKAIPPTGYYLTADKWMNTSALVERLNFAQQLTTSKLSGQRFDSSRLLALGLMAQPSRPGVRDATGAELALTVLETSLIAGDVAAQTNRLIQQQIEQQRAAKVSSSEILDAMAALVLGAPEFQLH